MPDDVPMTLQERRVIALKAFRDRHKGETITPKMLLDEVRAHQWPDLYDFFDWDDASAGETHRLEQAKTLLRIKEIYTVTPTVSVRIPLTISDPRRGGGGSYVSIVDVVTNVELSRLAMVAELMQIKRALNRAHQIALATRFASSIGEWLGARIADIEEQIGGLESGATKPPPLPDEPRRRAAGRR